MITTSRWVENWKGAICDFEEMGVLKAYFGRPKRGITQRPRGRQHKGIRNNLGFEEQGRTGKAEIDWSNRDTIVSVFSSLYLCLWILLI